MRARAEELVTLELGHKNEREVPSELEREVLAERWTRPDRAIARQADDTGLIDLQPSPDDPTDRELRRRLERWSLAEPNGPGRWIVAENAERALNELGTHRDTITIMHRPLKEQGIERSIPDYVMHGPSDRRDKSPLSEGGFGREVREALLARIGHLASEGLVRREGSRVTFAAGSARNALPAGARLGRFPHCGGDRPCLSAAC
jgi:hypothetical protein